MSLILTVRPEETITLTLGGVIVEVRLAEKQQVAVSQVRLMFTAPQEVEIRRGEQKFRKQAPAQHQDRQPGAISHKEVVEDGHGACLGSGG